MRTHFSIFIVLVTCNMLSALVRGLQAGMVSRTRGLAMAIRREGVGLPKG